MLICYYYKVFQPVRNHYQFDEFTKPVFEVEIDNGIHPCKLSLFEEDGSPVLSRIVLSEMPDRAITSELDEMIYTLNQHLLVVLKMSGLPNVSFFPNPIWYFLEDGQDHKMGITIDQKYKDLTVDYDNVKKLFTNSFNDRMEVRLFYDGQEASTPLQYRYLSFYRLLEKFYSEDGENWKKDQLEEALKPFEDEYKALNISSKSLYNYIHSLRQKCAHYKAKDKGKNKKEAAGITHVNYKGAAEVEKFLPIMASICFSEMKERYNILSKDKEA